MRIIVLDEEFPYPLNTGKRIRSFNLLSRLASRHELKYLAYGTTDSDSFRHFEQCSMNPVPVAPQIQEKSGLGFYFKLLVNLVSSHPYIVTSHHSKLFADRLKAEIEEFKPDIIICEWTPYALFVKNISGPKKIIVAHNIESTIWQRYYENESNLGKRLYIKEQYHKIMQFERDAFGWVDGITAVSAEEAKEIQGMTRSTPVEEVDNGVDLNFFKSSGETVSADHLVFTGSMDWRPNQDCATYFVSDIFPLLRKTRPNLEATFVGRNPTDEIKQLGNIEGIHITGTVDDVRPYINKAAVYIVPLRIGGGSRLKILEALAMQKAVVSTSVGAEGLDTTPGKDILIADSPVDFARTIIEALDDPRKRVTLGQAGRELVVRRYGWDSLADKLDLFIKSLVEQK